MRGGGDGSGLDGRVGVAGGPAAPDPACIARPSLRLLLPLLALLAPTAGSGQISLVEGDAFRLGLSGYVRSLTGVHEAAFAPPAGDRRSAFNGEVARLRWTAAWGERIQLEVHDRLQLRVSTREAGLGSPVAGFGVSADPGRAVDLESVWIDDERLRVWHDVDRLAVRVRTPVADLTAGRQAVSWGIAALFPVADLWGRFSPFELDTEEKPGVDAVRALAYPAAGLEVDAVVADRGERDDVSAGARATLSLPSNDVYVAAGRFWNEALALAGVSWLFETVKLRAEVAVGRDVDRDEWLDPRATLGLDWLRGRLSVSGELHFNGPGASDPGGYLEQLRSETFARGESYYLGRYYAGVVADWAVDRAERWRLGGSLILNLEDASSTLSPVLTWDLGEATTLSLGGLVALGDPPALAGAVAGGAVPDLRSEFGTYGDLGYSRISVYF